MLKKKLGLSAIERNWEQSSPRVRNIYKIPSSLVIPESCRKIGDWAFWKCKELREVEIPESVEEIGEDAFYDCYNLKKVIIPESVESIEGWSFWGCVSLREVKIPKSCRRIKDSAFANCRNLRKVVIPESVETIDFKAFRGCDKAVVILRKPRNKFDYISPVAFLGCKDVEYVEEENRN